MRLYIISTFSGACLICCIYCNLNVFIFCWNMIFVFSCTNRAANKQLSTWGGKRRIKALCRESIASCWFQWWYSIWTKMHHLTKTPQASLRTGIKPVCVSFSFSFQLWPSHSALWSDLRIRTHQRHPRIQDNHPTENTFLHACFSIFGQNMDWVWHFTFLSGELKAIQNTSGQHQSGLS